MFRKLYSGEDVERWQRGVKAYERHLLRRRSQMPRDLWRYFSTQLFHDGLMSMASSRLFGQAVELSISCPNVQRRTRDGWVYASLDFTCLFLGVDYLRISFDNEQRPWRADGRQDCQFLYAEIDTVFASELAIKNRQPFHSLVIQMDAGWIEFTFAKCRVRPANETLFRRMRQNRHRFYIPFPGRAPAWTRISERTKGRA